MPKIPKHEFEKYTNPESEEYTPDMAEIESDRQNEQAIKEDLAHMAHQLTHPGEDFYTGEKSKYAVKDPELFWDSLAYLEIDCLDKIKDPELKKELKEKISKTEQKIYKIFIPFVESRINTFGWHNSPLEKYTPRHKLTPEDVQSHFDKARKELERFQLSEEEKISLRSDLDRLQQKFERYRDEPTLFSFENIEEELHKNIFNVEFRDYGIGRIKEPAGLLDDEKAREEEKQKFEQLLGKGHQLNEIASRMLSEDIRTNCEERAKSLFDHIEYLKAKSEAPRELIVAEAELKNLFGKAKAKQQIDAEILKQWTQKITEMKDKKLGVDYRTVIDKLSKLLERVKRARLGEEVDEDEERFKLSKGDMNWAWLFLDVERDASKEEVRKAYYKLALKYHPDISKKPDAAEKMKQINEAFELINRVKSYK